jgi:hypothetical protein
MIKLVLDSTIDVAIKQLVQGVADSARAKYESYFDSDFEVEEIEHKSRDGFIAFTNGGYTCSIPFALDSVANGNIFHPAIKECYDSIILDCMRDFISNNELLSEDSDKALYSLSEGYLWGIIDIDEETKESYYNFESEYCESVYWITVRAIYYDATQDINKKGYILFDLAYNLDDYGRDNKAKNIFSTVLSLDELALETIKDVENKMQSFI